MQPTSEKYSYLELSYKNVSLKENWFCFNQSQGTIELKGSLDKTVIFLQ